MALEVTITGLDELIDVFGSADATSVTRGAMEEAMYAVWAAVPRYPPPPPDSTYRRTGSLGRSTNTDVRAVGSDVVGMIGNPMVYAPFVIDKDRQAGQMSHWWNLQDVVTRNIPRVVAIVERRIMKALGGK